MAQRFGRQRPGKYLKVEGSPDPKTKEASPSQAQDPGKTQSRFASPEKDSREVNLPSRDQIRGERSKLRRERAFRQALSSTISALLVVAALAVLIATLLLPVLQISGTSMEPTLYNGDIIVLMKTGNYDRGDLCSFAYENKYLIKRIIGIPGDSIEIDAEGTVFVNGTALDEPYVTEKALGECDLEFPYQVPDDRYFVMGDHRSTSIDSRSSVIGCIDKTQIVGRVLLRIWPLTSFAIIQ